MSWNAQRISDVARKSAAVDFAAFEAIGLSEIEHASVLDMGCFDGYNTVLKFAPYSNIDRVVGVDLFEAAIETARERTDDARFCWELADAETYDAPDESFDVLYYSHSFQHVRDKGQTLRNAFRLLKPGGYIVIKTIDDSLMISSPDPQAVVSELVKFYAEKTRPFCPHTSNTDRFNGKKCPSLLVKAGFSAVRLKVLYTDTLGKTLEQRLDLLERLTYFRRKVPAAAGAEAARKMQALLDSWETMMRDDAYYFATPTVVALARKPLAVGDPAPADYWGPWFEREPDFELGDQVESGCGWQFSPMRETDLGTVMEIESNAFPSPWTPLAFALELRYNRESSYVVARDAKGIIRGYIGIWMMNEVACITRVAVAGDARRLGLGSDLVEHSCIQAVEHGCTCMRLTVREGNEVARRFYRALQFKECARNVRYYTDPDEDGITMERMLQGSA